MKNSRKLFYPFVGIVISLTIIVFTPSLALRSEEIEESPVPATNPNIKIYAGDDFPGVVKINKKYPVAKNYPITWKIEGLAEGQQITHTDIHWVYLADLNTPEEINDYKNYPDKGKEFTLYQYEYADDIYIDPYNIKLPCIMLVIHGVIDSQDYTLGPVPIDIVVVEEEE